MQRAELGFFPTELYKLDNLSAQYGVNIYLKRDDLKGYEIPSEKANRAVKIFAEKKLLGDLLEK